MKRPTQPTTPADDAVGAFLAAARAMSSAGFLSLSARTEAGTYRLTFTPKKPDPTVGLREQALRYSELRKKALTYCDTPGCQLLMGHAERCAFIGPPPSPSRCRNEGAAGPCLLPEGHGGACELSRQGG